MDFRPQKIRGLAFETSPCSPISTPTLEAKATTKPSTSTLHFRCGPKKSDTFNRIRPKNTRFPCAKLGGLCFSGCIWSWGKMLGFGDDQAPFCDEYPEAHEKIHAFLCDRLPGLRNVRERFLYGCSGRGPTVAPGYLGRWSREKPRDFQVFTALESVPCSASRDDIDDI